MSDLNNVTISGRLTRDVELRYTPNGTAVADIGVAVGEKWKDKNSGQMQESTCFVDVTCWGNQAENVSKFFNKGDGIIIVGKLKMDSWDDKNTGQKRTKLKIQMGSFVFPPSKSSNNGGGGGAPAQNYSQPQGQPQYPAGYEDDSDIPF